VFYGLFSLPASPGPTRLSKWFQILYNLLFAHEVLKDSGEQSDGTSL
jgi:hypothetical protein